MTVCDSELQFDFLSDRPVVVKFSDLELSSDAGILLARQAEEKVQVCRGIAHCIADWRDPNKITLSLEQLVSQRVYQLVGGYEDAIDSNQLRHDPVYKIACGRLPIPEQELLASQVPCALKWSPDSSTATEKRLLRWCSISMAGMTPLMDSNN
jgi:hypothetical protein